MDKLPIFLRNAIENACGIYTNISYTVHGDDSKTRISIMFTQGDNKQSKRKSNATVSRDAKRMKDHIENTKDTDNKKSHETNNEIRQETVYNVDRDDEESSAMEVDSKIVRSANNNKAEKTTDDKKSSVNRTKEKLKSREVDVEKKNKCVDEIGTANSNSNEIMNNKNSTDEGIIKVTAEMILSKVVIKHSRFGPDRLIGKVTGSNKLVMYNKKNNSVTEILPSNPNYESFLENVEFDFEDVRTNPYRDTFVDKKIDEMAVYAMDNELFTEECLQK